MFLVFLLHILLTLLHLTTAIPTVQPKTLDLEPRQRPCAINNKINAYMKNAIQGFCTPIANQDPGGYNDDIIGLDFDFDFETNICGYHVYWDSHCKTCARSTLNRTSVEVGDHGIACLSQDANGGWWKSIKAAPCDGTGIGCWDGGMMEVEGDQAHCSGHSYEWGPERGSGYGSGQDSGCDSGCGSGHDSGRGSGQDSEQDSECGSGHGSEQDSGHSSGQDSGQDAGHGSEQDPGHSSGQDSEQDSGCSSGHSSEQGSGCGSEQDSRCGSEQGSGCGSEQDSRCGSEQGSGCGSEQDSRCGSEQGSGCGSEQDSRCGSGCGSGHGSG